MHLWSKMKNLLIRTTAIIMHNLYLWRLVNMDCYIKDNLFDVFKYSLISLSCCAGLWLATTDAGLKYRKITCMLILPSFTITPIFVTAEHYLLTTLVIGSGILAFLRIFGVTHDKMAFFAKR